MSDAQLERDIQKQLDTHRETLRATSFFCCASCQKTKPAGEAAGVHAFRTENPQLLKAMIDRETGRMRIGTYAICLECMDSLPDDVIYQNATRSMAKQGLFGDAIA